MSLQMMFQTMINLLSILMYKDNKSNYIFQPSIIPFILQMILLALGILALGLVGQLSIFHLWLRYNNLSTFELIKMQREFEEEEKQNNDPEQGK